MTNEQFEQAKAIARKLIPLREGQSLKVYKDSLGKLTVGVGHLVLPKDKLKAGDSITPERMAAIFEADLAAACAAAFRQCKDADVRTVELAAGLISVIYQMGPKWNVSSQLGGKGFVNTWEAIKSRQYIIAISRVQSSLWAKQTPVRVDDFVTALQAERAYWAKITP